MGDGNVFARLADVGLRRPQDAIDCPSLEGEVLNGC